MSIAISIWINIIIVAIFFISSYITYNIPLYLSNKTGFSFYVNKLNVKIKNIWMESVLEKFFYKVSKIIVFILSFFCSKTQFQLLREFPITIFGWLLAIIIFISFHFMLYFHSRDNISNSNLFLSDYFLIIPILIIGVILIALGFGIGRLILCPNIASLLFKREEGYKLFTDWTASFRKIEKIYRKYPESVSLYYLSGKCSYTGIEFANEIENKQLKIDLFKKYFEIVFKQYFENKENVIIDTGKLRVMDYVDLYSRYYIESNFESIVKETIALVSNKYPKAFVIFLKTYINEEIVKKLGRCDFFILKLKFVLENKTVIYEYEDKIKRIKNEQPLFYNKYIKSIIEVPYDIKFDYLKNEIYIYCHYWELTNVIISFIKLNKQQFNNIEQNLKRVEYLKQKYPESIRVSEMDNLIANQQFFELNKMANIPDEKWQEEENAIHILYQEIRNKTKAIYPHGYEIWEKMRDKSRDLENTIDTIRNFEEEFRMWEDVFVKHLYNIKHITYSDIFIELFLEKQFDLEKWKSYKNTVQFIKIPEHSEKEDILSLIPKYFRSDTFISNIPYRYFFKYRPDSVQFLSQTEFKTREVVFAFKNNGEHKDILATIKKFLSELFKSIDNELIQLRHINPSSSKYFVFVCIPSSSQKDYEKRCKDFSAELCKDLGMMDGFPYMKVVHDITPTHYGGSRDDIRVSYDDIFFRKKHVILFDDIVTTGGTMTKYINLMTSLGAKVDYAISFAKTFS